jgi:hypothetical protein
MKNIVYLVLVLVCLLVVVEVSAKGIKAPYVGGQTMTVGQGNEDDPKNTVADPNLTHLSSLGMAYAWDFNWSWEDNDKGMPMVAPANGKIIISEFKSGWGNTVIIEYETDNDYKFGRFAHLDQSFVKVGQKVKQGQVIGLLGKTGLNYYGAHFHYQTQDVLSNGISVPSVFEDIGKPLQDYSYTSKNTNIFDLRESTPHSSNKKVLDVFGSRDSNIIWHHTLATPIINEIISVSGVDKGMSKNVYLQNYVGKPCAFDVKQLCDGAVVYDGLGGARSAYIVGWQQWNGSYLGVANQGWSSLGGPQSVSLHNPITNSYWYQTGTADFPTGCWRQDFQMSWMCYEKVYSYSGGAPPGLYAPQNIILGNDTRWDAITSYAFAEGYERNGSAVNLGSAYNDNSGTVYVHNWTIVKNNISYTVRIQNFNGGKFGSLAIIYNPNNNEAYVIRHGFWDYYRFNEGPYLLGFPLEDEHSTSTAGQLSRQNFEKGYLIWDGKNVKAYNDNNALLPATNSVTGHTLMLSYSNVRTVLTPSNLIITGITTINENDSSQFSAKIVYTDGSSADATQIVSWGTDCLNSSITSIGLFMASGVSSDTLCSIKAVYSGLSVSQNITIKNSNSSIGGIINPDYVINRYATAKSVSTQTYQPITETSLFTNQDGYIYLWLDLKNIYKQLTVAWKWYDPKGNLFATYETTTGVLQTGYYWTSLQFYSWTELGVGNATGQWNVDIFINNNKALTQYFNYVLKATSTSDFIGNFKINKGATTTGDRQVLLEMWNMDIHPSDGLNTAIAKWLVSEDPNAYPSEIDGRWTDDAPRSFTLSSGKGLKTLYLWFVDGAGYVNNPPMKAEIYYKSRPMAPIMLMPQ